MAITTIADMQIVPDKFTEYTLQRTTEKSMLVRSGVTTSDDRVARLINGTPKGGNKIIMPFYNPLSGEDEVFGEQALTPDNITTDQEVATLLIRQKAWGDTDLSKVFGGSDPMAAIGNLVADWWVTREQAIMLSILKGLFVKDTGALKAHVMDISAEASDNVISVDATLDAKQLMGDAADKLGLVFMHSATYTRLQKNQQITTEYDSDLKVKIEYYLGYQVVVDDGMPVASGVYDTYFIGKGAIVRDDGMPQGLVGTETDRDKLAAANYLINRRALVLHPSGVSYVGNIAPEKYATNAELATAANWQLAVDHKKVPLVCLRHKI